MKIYISGAFDQWRATTARQFLFFPPKCLLGIPIDKKGQTSIAGIYYTVHTSSQKKEKETPGYKSVCLCRVGGETSSSRAHRVAHNSVGVHSIKWRDGRTDLGSIGASVFEPFAPLLKGKKRNSPFSFVEKPDDHPTGHSFPGVTYTSPISAGRLYTYIIPPYLFPSFLFLFFPSLAIVDCRTVCTLVIVVFMRAQKRWAHTDE